MAIHIVLVEPEIPPNTGNIARTAAATDSVLHLVKPLGFSLDEKSLRRAGLDYWPYVTLEVHESLEEFLEKHEGRRMWLATTKGGKLYTEADFRHDTLRTRDRGAAAGIHRGPERSGDPHTDEPRHEAALVQSVQRREHSTVRSVETAWLPGTGITRDGDKRKGSNLD